MVIIMIYPRAGTQVSHTEISTAQVCYRITQDDKLAEIYRDAELAIAAAHGKIASLEEPLGSTIGSEISKDSIFPKQNRT